MVQQQHTRTEQVRHDDSVIDEILDNTEQETITQDALGELTRAEIDIQITTAKKFPRSIREFTRKATEMACLNEEIAASCMYALPRSNKTIEGPSARLAEIVAVAWGNLRSGARVINIGESFLTSQGFAHDLESNVATTIEVQRRITTKTGRMSDDMIVVTGNAASSIALRNAVFKVVPKAYWWPVYLAARKTAVGDATTLVNRRINAVAHFAKMGVSQQQILDVLDRKGIEDVTLDDLAKLAGMLTAIKEGDVTVDEAFAPKENRAAKVDALLSGKNGTNGTKKPEPKNETKAPKAETETPEAETETPESETKQPEQQPDREKMVDQLKAAISKAKDKQDLADIKAEVYQVAELIGGDHVELLVSEVDAKSAGMGGNGNGNGHKRQKSGEKF